MNPANRENLYIFGTMGQFATPHGRDRQPFVGPCAQELALSKPPAKKDHGIPTHFR